MYLGLYSIAIFQNLQIPNLLRMTLTTDATWFSFISEYWYIYLFLMLQMWTMKITESTNIFCTSDRLVCTIKVNIKEGLIGSDGFLKMLMWWMDCSQRIKDLLLDKFSIHWEKGRFLLLRLHSGGTLGPMQISCCKILQSTMTW